MTTPEIQPAAQRPKLGSYQYSLRSLLIAVSAFSVLVAANTRRCCAIVLGHIEGENADGFLIFGCEYGWPWAYRTEASKNDIVSESVFDNFFDDFYWWGLTGDIFVGITIVGATVVILESVLTLPGILRR